MRTRLAEAFPRLDLRIKRVRNSAIARYNARTGVFPVEIRSTVGLGAKLEWALEIMAYCDGNDLAPRFKFSFPSSDAHEDHFGAFFQIHGSRQFSGRFLQISSITELPLDREYDLVLNLDLAHHLITKYLKVREAVLGEVESFCDRNFEGRVLGVHYRGTDKALEAPPVSHETVRNNVDHYLEIYPDTTSVFVASDDANFITRVADGFFSRPVIYRADSSRSRDRSAVHEAAHADTYAVSRDAIVNCLILARCDALLKTASILSGWSKLFNPDLPTVMLSAPYEDYLWFPERDLVKRNLFEPVE